MSVAAELELQGAVLAQLKADAAVMSLLAGRVHDHVPEETSHPYCSFGPADAVQEDDDCSNAVTVALQIDVWSRKPGSAEAKGIAAAIRRSLHDADLTLTDNALVYIQHRDTSTFTDADGLTTHAAMTFEAVVEQP